MAVVEVRFHWWAEVRQEIRWRFALYAQTIPNAVKVNAFRFEPQLSRLHGPRNSIRHGGLVNAATNEFLITILTI